MKINLIQKLLKPFLILLFTIFSLNSFSQQTFTVVCDKTDNSVKVVESRIKSPNYVPIKGGFPFRQVAQKWIDDNLSTTQCDPDEIMKKIKLQTKVPNNVAPGTSTIPTPPKRTSSGALNTNRSFQPAHHYRNTSLIIDAKFSNLGEAFRLNNKLMPGFEMGIEQLFGTKIYFGTGINMDMFFSDFDSRYDISQEFIYFFRIPAFVGYRMQNKKIMVMYEAGAEVNSKFTGTELDLESFNKTAIDHSFNFLARMSVGTERILLEFGSEIWLTDVFEAGNFDMSVFLAGLRFNF